MQRILIALTLFAVPLMTNAQDTVVLDNGVIRREIVCSGNHIAGKSYVLTATNAQFISGNSPEFYFTVNDAPYSGHSDWKNIKHSETTATDGAKTTVITFDNEKNFSVKLTYTVYPALPVVHKSLTIKNTGTSDIKVEAVDVEHHPFHRDRAESYEVLYRRCMQLFDELHKEAPDLFIDCTFETAGKLQLMDYGIAKQTGFPTSDTFCSTPLNVIFRLNFKSPT